MVSLFQNEEFSLIECQRAAVNRLVNLTETTIASGDDNDCIKGMDGSLICPTDSVYCIFLCCLIDGLTKEDLYMSSRMGMWCSLSSEPYPCQFSLRRCSVLRWTPDVATQLIVASDDDSSPSLRLLGCEEYNITKVKEFVGHTKGVIAMSWCPIDSSFLLTCAKDNRTICWDTISGEIWVAAAAMVEDGAQPTTSGGLWNYYSSFFAGEFLKEAKSFIEDGVHSQSLIRSFRAASNLVRNLDLLV
ncbi:hypothetical protein IFM89_028084 [Coptis chinensis]|uniref:Uncharacterized protein n=1 Tax=Coptis chinensis TaxID=261450 RepID=A0A835LN19_9MAGN|nr:hypothetical protein IFM89_028084 [Coptis chinensis]